jgi:hypothetical protein
MSSSSSDWKDRGEGEQGLGRDSEVDSVVDADAFELDDK